MSRLSAVDRDEPAESFGVGLPDERAGSVRGQADAALAPTDSPPFQTEALAETRLVGRAVEP